MVFLKIIGLLNAMYLLSLHGQTSPNCALSEGCSMVLTSVYSSLFGIPIAAFGIAVYLVLILLDWYRRKGIVTTQTFHSVSLVILLPATAVGLVLGFVQFAHIKAFCPFCALNSMILLILFFLVFNKQKLDSFKIELPSSVTISIIILSMLPLSTAYGYFKETKKDNHYGALIAGEMVSLNKIETEISTDLLDLERQIYQMRKSRAEYMVYELAAEKRQLKVDDYLKKYVFKDIQVTDQDVKDFYDKNSHQVGNASFDQVEQKIKRHLIRNLEFEAYKKHLDSLVNEFEVEYYLPKPRYVNVQPNPYNTYSIGNKEAKVKLIEFADLECGHCKHAYIKVKELIEKFEDDIYFEFRHFPLPFRRASREFAKGSICAGKQDKFWSYLDTTFANQGNLNQIKPQELAEKVGLDITSFNNCLTDNKTIDELDFDINEGESIEINSTPTFIINGQLLIGIPTENDIRSFYND